MTPTRTLRGTVATFLKSGVVVVFAAAALLAAAGSAHSGGFDHYPDLIAEEPGGAHLEIDVWPPGNPADPNDCLVMQQGDCRLLMQFDGLVTNVGDGPIHIEGNPQVDGVEQLILDDDSNPIASYGLSTVGPDPAIKYETTDDHDHWHLMKIMEYSLWNEAQTEQVVAGEKIGFCLWDISRYDDSGPETAVYNGGGNWCAAASQGGGPGATFLEMGVSQGWRDVYSFTINLQWIDVTDVPPGNYYLAGRPDPDDFIAESDETNNDWVFGSGLAIVPGHVAQDDTALVDTSLVGSIVFDLDVLTYSRTIDEDPDDGSQVNVSYPKGTLEYTVETLPANGTLLSGGFPVVPGTPFTDSTLTYTPDGGFLGDDPFTFTAADSMSAYPLNPVVATVTMSVDDNSPPVITDPGDRSNEAGFGVGLGIGITDPNGDPFTMSAEGLPPGINTSGVVLSGTPLIPGVYDVTLTADDGVGGVSQVSFEWEITGDLVLPFEDVGSGHVFAEDITWMFAMGISLGCGDGSEFCPDDLVTREQIASFLVRAFDLSDGAGDDLFDDDDGSVHEDNIDRLATAGVTSGCDDDLFCPLDNLPRGQFASLLIRALEDLTGADYSAAVGADYFTDDDGLVHEGNIDKLRYAGVTLGCGETTFCPLDTLTRGQLAALLYRALG